MLQAMARIAPSKLNEAMARIAPRFWYFWLTSHNKTNRHVSNAFGLLAVFISFPLARAAAAVAAADFCCCCCCCGGCGFLLLLLRAPTPPRPPFLGEGKYQKNKIADSVGGGS
jgi:hypothetical protein